MYRCKTLLATLRGPTAILCVFLLASPNSVILAQQTSAPAQKLSGEQLDSLVAPIALYPDALLGQTLVSSTYPLEIVQLYQWLEQNKGLKPQQLADAVKQKNWDPSVQAMVVFPDVVKNMNDNIGWTNDLGNAFLAQQGDVMDAVQRMRVKAKDSGRLTTTEQQTVDTKVIENKTVVVIEPSNPEVVYVPAYDPMAVWGPPAYPYPPVYYPPGAYVATGLISFGVGMAIGAAWGGGWGWGCGWGGNNIVINNNNNFINHYNRNQIANGGNRYAGNGNQWRHHPEHRGGVPYGDRNTAQRFGGTVRNDSASARQGAARQNIGRTQAGIADRGGAGGVGGPGGIGRPGGAGGVGGPGGVGRPGGVGGPGGVGRPGGAGSVGGPGGVGSASRVSPGSGMSGDRIGNRQTSTPSPGRNSAFGGASGMSGSGARVSSQRGASSMRGGYSGGGGFRGGGGGGGRGGGGRGGGRRR